MFKGIAALFSSGLIFNPMVLIGIILGAIFSFYLPAKDIISIYQDWPFYLMAWALACIYNLIFKRVYKEDERLDMTEMSVNSLISALKMIIASGLSVVFFMVMLAP